MFIASASYELTKESGIDSSKIIFSGDYLTEKAQSMSTDDHSGYHSLERLIGVFSCESALVVLFLCSSEKQQSLFGKAEQLGE